jgi:hypothetical protein
LGKFSFDQLLLKMKATLGAFLTEALADLLRDVMATPDHKLTIVPSLKNSNGEIRCNGCEATAKQAKTGNEVSGFLREPQDAQKAQEQWFKVFCFLGKD